MSDSNDIESPLVSSTDWLQNGSACTRSLRIVEQVVVLPRADGAKILRIIRHGVEGGDRVPRCESVDLRLDAASAAHVGRLLLDAA